MNPPEPPEELSPAELRLREHLEVLRTDTLTPSALLVARVVRTARWQRTIRRPLAAMGALAGAAVEGIRLLFGPREGRS